LCVPSIAIATLVRVVSAVAGPSINNVPPPETLIEVAQVNDPEVPAAPKTMEPTSVHPLKPVVQLLIVNVVLEVAGVKAKAVLLVQYMGMVMVSSEATVNSPNIWLLPRGAAVVPPVKLAWMIERLSVTPVIVVPLGSAAAEVRLPAVVAVVEFPVNAPVKVVALILSEESLSAIVEAVAAVV